MPLNLTLGVDYDYWPLVAVRVVSPQTGLTRRLQVTVDTGAEATVLDRSVAIDLGIDLEASETRSLSGIGGRILAAPVEPISIQLLGLPDFFVEVRAIFVDGVNDSFGNLVGLDFLESVDFGLSHSERIAYFGLPT